MVAIALAGRTGPAAVPPPAALAEAIAPDVAVGTQPLSRRPREAGTDGLMGRLPFDLPADPVVPLVNRFTIDDVVSGRPEG